MVVAFFNLCIDAPPIDLRSDRGILRMFTINFDPPAETRELAVSCAEELMHTEANRRTRWLDLVAPPCRHGTAERGAHERGDEVADFNFEMFFACVPSVFKSGVRESGSRPNKFPNA